MWDVCSDILIILLEKSNLVPLFHQLPLYKEKMCYGNVGKKTSEQLVLRSNHPDISEKLREAAIRSRTGVL